MFLINYCVEFNLILLVSSFSFFFFFVGVGWLIDFVGYVMCPRARARACVCVCVCVLRGFVITCMDCGEL